MLTVIVIVMEQNPSYLNYNSYNTNFIIIYFFSIFEYFLNNYKIDLKIKIYNNIY